MAYTDPQQVLALVTRFSQMFAGSLNRVEFGQFIDVIHAASDSNLQVNNTWSPWKPMKTSPLKQDCSVGDDFFKRARDHIGLFGHFATSSRNKAIPFPVTVTLEDLCDVWRAYGGSICPILGIKGTWEKGHDLRLSFDRIDPCQGYIQGNIMIVHTRINAAKWMFTGDL
ncbi:hypothetical protein BGX29_004233, partial [Mortierella sp. GBA35]